MTRSSYNNSNLYKFSLIETFQKKPKESVITYKSASQVGMQYWKHLVLKKIYYLT